VAKRRTYVSRAYWDNYINSLIESIAEDRDTIVDMLMYGCLESAKITMNISLEEAPTYTFEINKFGEKSPFGDDEDDE
jgi:hypothetical protein